MVNEQYNQLQLDAHNNYRMMHGADPLMYDEDLARQAQAYAMVLETSNSFAHSPRELREG